MRFSDNSGFQYYANPANPWQRIKQFFAENNVLGKLIIINVGVWLALLLADTVLWLFQSYFYQHIIHFLAVHSNIYILITHPWTLVSYMFVHEGFWHLLFNMLWLYWFGKIFLEYLTERQLLAIYLMGGIAGALFYVLTFNIFPSFEHVFYYSYAIGASASVMAVLVAISFYVPDYRMNLLFIGPVKIYWLAIFFFVYDLLSIKSANAGGHLSHIGGAILGWLFVYFLQRGRDITLGFSSLLEWIARPFSYNKRNTFRVSSYAGKKFTDEEYNQQKHNNQQRVDAILDKIAKSGYNSLSKEEKDFLFRSSRK